MNFRDENESTSLSASYTGHFVFLEEGTESSLEYFKVSYNFKIWIINSDSKSWSALSFLYFMTFYKLQNFLKSPPQNAGNGMSGTLYFKMFPGSLPPDRLQVSRAFGARPPGKNKTLCLLTCGLIRVHESWWGYMKVDESTMFWQKPCFTSSLIY